MDKDREAKIDKMAEAFVETMKGKGASVFLDILDGEALAVCDIPKNTKNDLHISSFRIDEQQSLITSAWNSKETDEYTKVLKDVNILGRLKMISKTGALTLEFSKNEGPFFTVNVPIVEEPNTMGFVFAVVTDIKEHNSPMLVDVGCSTHRRYVEDLAKVGKLGKHAGLNKFLFVNNQNGEISLPKDKIFFQSSNTNTRTVNTYYPPYKNIWLGPTRQDLLYGAYAVKHECKGAAEPQLFTYMPENHPVMDFIKQHLPMAVAHNQALLPVHMIRLFCLDVSLATRRYGRMPTFAFNQTIDLMLSRYSQGTDPTFKPIEALDKFEFTFNARDSITPVESPTKRYSMKLEYTICAFVRMDSPTSVYCIGPDMRAEFPGGTEFEKIIPLKDGLNPSNLQPKDSKMPVFMSVARQSVKLYTVKNLEGRTKKRDEKGKDGSSLFEDQIRDGQKYTETTVIPWSK